MYKNICNFYSFATLKNIYRNKKENYNKLYFEIKFFIVTFIIKKLKFISFFIRFKNNFIKLHISKYLKKMAAFIAKQMIGSKLDSVKGINKHVC